MTSTRLGAPPAGRLDLGLGLLCAAVAGLVGFFVHFPLMDTDLWWHLAAGRTIVEERRLLFVDPFAADTAGVRWVDVHWLFQVGVYLVHRAGGVAAIVAAKTALTALGAALLFRWACARVPRTWWPAAALLVAAFLFPARHLVLARPTVVTLLALAITLVTVDRIRRDGRISSGWPLLPIQIVWANAQGLFLLGPAVVGCFLLGELLEAAVDRARGDAPARAGRRERLRALAAWTLLMALAGLATPYGLDGLRLPFKLLGRIDALEASIFSREIAENVPPWILERTSRAEVAPFKWLEAITFLSFLPLLRRGLPVGRLLLATAFFVLALTANRNLLLFVWVAGPLVAQNLGEALAARASSRASAPSPRRRAIAVAVAAAAAIGAAALCARRAAEARSEPPTTALAPFRVPVEAVDALEAAGLADGPIFCADRYGGYVAYRLHPRARPTMDGRFVLRSAARLAEHLGVVDHPARFEAYRRREGIRTVLLPTDYPDRYVPLVVTLVRDPRWRLVYTDGTQVLLLLDEDRRLAGRGVDLADPSAVQAIADGLAARHGRHPAVHARARQHLARLLAELGHFATAEALLATTPGAPAAALRARVAYMAGAPERARRLAEALLVADPHETESLCLLALLAEDAGDRPRALALLARALDADPHHPLARGLVARIRSEGAP